MNKPTRYALVFLTLILVCSQSLNVSGSGEFLKRLEGDWLGEGKAFGNVARLRMNWEWVLGGKFLRLSLRNEIQSSGGQQQVFEGSAFYRSTGERNCEGTWFDSQGASYEIKCSLEGNTLAVLWGPDGKEHGRSLYSFLDSGKLEVVDSVKQKDGTWKEFGTFLMTRQ